MMKINLIETQNALQEYEKNGSNLRQEMIMDFFISSEDKIIKDEIELEIKNRIKNIENIFIEYDEEYKVWTLYVSCKLIPQAKKVHKIENDLYDIAQKYDAYYDGFGSYGNAER